MTGIRIVCGGQTGVDRGALEAARAMGIEYGGWCPAGGWAEDLPSPPGIRADYPRLVETPTSEPAQRTEWNVRDSDATLVLVDQAGLAASPGTALTVRLAEYHERPHGIFDVDAEDGACDVEAWLFELGTPLIVNVAGPRESEAPGIQRKVRDLFESVFRHTIDVSRGPIPTPGQ